MKADDDTVPEARHTSARTARGSAQDEVAIEKEAYLTGEPTSASPCRAKPSSRIMDQFDPAFYLRLNPDVEKSGLDPVEHYVGFGFHERRYPCAEWFWADIEAIERSGVLEGDQEQDGRDAETRLRDFQNGEPPTHDFDTNFIASYYPRSLSPGENVFAFYCRHAHQPWCFANFDLGVEDFDRVRTAPLFNDEHVRNQMSPALRELDTAAYYYTEGFRAGINPSSSFNTRAYLAAYTDIVEVQAEPMLHYLEHGRHEGRSSKSSGGLAPNGERAFQPDRMTLLVCSHEASRTGAPLVGLNLAREYADQVNVISVLLRGGVLKDDFLALSQACFVVGDSYGAVMPAIDELIERFRPTAAILNSVETTILLPSLLAKDVPAVSLVHEFAQYVHPFNVISRAATLSDRVVFPSALVKSAALRELAQLGLDTVRPRNLTVRPQGLPILPSGIVKSSRLPSPLQRRSASSRPLVVGAGWVQPRKGVDLFIETARVLKHDLGVEADFLWVGGNYEPRRDLTLAAYLEDQIEASGLRDFVHFAEEQEDLTSIIKAADAFFMSSRLDPYPNVALDAISQGVPVVCFQRGTGIADLAARWPDRVHAAPYNDTRKAAQMIASIFETSTDHRAARLPLPADLQRLLSFPNYAEDIMRIVRGVVADRSATKELHQSLETPGNMNSPLFLAELPPWLSSSPDLTTTSSGLARLANRVALNGFPLARIGRDRIAFISENQSTETADGWSAGDGLTAPQSPTDRSAPFSVIMISEDIEAVRRLYALVLLFPQLYKLALVSDTIAAADLRPSTGRVLKDFEVYARTPQTAAKLESIQDSGPIMMFDDLPIIRGQHDWRRTFCASAGIADGQTVTLLGRLSGELKPRLNAKTTTTQAESPLNRRMIEPWVAVGSMEGKTLQVMLRIMLADEKAELWSSLLSAWEEAPSACKVVHHDILMDGRDYDLLVGRVPIQLPSEGISRLFSLHSGP